MNKPNFGYWRFEYRYNDGQWRTFTHYGHRPGTADNVRGIRPLYEHPAPAQPATDPTVEAALKEATALAMVLWRKHYSETAPNWKPLSDLPGVLSQIDNMTAGLSRTPEQPATDPAVEAARRKALREILSALTNEFAWDDDCAGVVRVGVLRDLVGQPRKDPERRIAGYDEEPDLKVSATMHASRVNTADLAKSDLFNLIVSEIEPETPTDEKALRRLASKIYEEGYSRSGE